MSTSIPSSMSSAQSTKLFSSPTSTITTPAQDADYLRLALWCIVIVFVLNYCVIQITGIDPGFQFAFIPTRQLLTTSVPLLLAGLLLVRFKLNTAAAFCTVSALAPLFGALALTLSYEIHAIRAPLADPLLHKADLALGFHWEAYVTAIKSNRYLDRFLVTAYNSMPMQMAIAPVAIVILRPHAEAYRFFALCLLVALIGIMIACFLPAIGMLESADPILFDPARFHAATPREIVMLMRDHKTGDIDFSSPIGAFNFPSFHTISACTSIYAHRDTFLRIPAILTNVPIMFAAIAYGAHYLVDVIAGVGTFFTALVLLNLIENKSSQPITVGL